MSAAIQFLCAQTVEPVNIHRQMVAVTADGPVSVTMKTADSVV
jgi:hypothetical protein